MNQLFPTEAASQLSHGSSVFSSSVINSNASLTVSLAQTPYCKKHRYDPQNPLCAHIIFCGGIVKVNDSEADIAKKALFSRHPEMESWPKDHNWFFAKFNITNIWVLDYFGGLKIVTPEEYYSVKPYPCFIVTLESFTRVGINGETPLLHLSFSPWMK
ncbi:protein CREG1 isoform X4 [Heliangelus exortis]|uniref:protein CREG1 isoform X4 n=1 Tax=Heliangelus exortis TaxID=472823 RepID=UPI003A92A7A7